MMLRISLIVFLCCLAFALAKLNPVHRDFLKAINEVRRSKGVKRVCLSEKLNVASLEHSKWMGKKGKLMHGADGNLKSRILKARYPWKGAAAENIALNTDRSGRKVVHQWVKSPKHFANIVNGKYNQVGIGAFEVKKKIWWTMVIAMGNDKCALS